MSSNQLNLPMNQPALLTPEQQLIAEASGLINANIVSLKAMEPYAWCVNMGHLPHSITGLTCVYDLVILASEDGHMPGLTQQLNIQHTLPNNKPWKEFQPLSKKDELIEDFNDRRLYLLNVFEACLLIINTTLVFDLNAITAWIGFAKSTHKLLAKIKAYLEAAMVKNKNEAVD